MQRKEREERHKCPHCNIEMKKYTRYTKTYPHGKGSSPSFRFKHTIIKCKNKQCRYFVVNKIYYQEFSFKKFEKGKYDNF